MRGYLVGVVVTFAVTVALAGLRPALWALEAREGETDHGRD